MKLISDEKTTTIEINKDQSDDDNRNKSAIGVQAMLSDLSLMQRHSSLKQDDSTLI